MSIAILALASLQSPWIVDRAGGPGTHFTDLPAAVAAAASGDAILVRAGSYTPFQCSGKALRIRGEDAVATRIAGDGSLATTIRDVPFGAAFTIVGCRFAPPRPSEPGVPGQPALQVAGAASVVVLGDCILIGGSAGERSNDGGDGLRLDGAQVFAARCRFQGGGGDAAFLAIGGAGVALHGGFLAATDCNLFGGAATTTYGGALGGRGLAVDVGGLGLAIAELQSCVVNGAPGADQRGFDRGGDGVGIARGPAFVRVAGAGSVVRAGAGATPGVAVAAAAGSAVFVHGPVPLVVAGAGAATVGAVALGAPALPRLGVDGAARTNGELVAGSAATLSVRGGPAWSPVLVGIDVAPEFALPIASASTPVVGGRMLAPAAFHTPAFLDGGGALQVGFPVPAAAVFVGRPLFAQAAVIDPAAGVVMSNLTMRVFAP